MFNDIYYENLISILLKSERCKTQYHSKTINRVHEFLFVAQNCKPFAHMNKHHIRKQE